MFTHTPAPPPWRRCRSVPFQRGALPATHSTLPVNDPPYVPKKETFTLLPFSADARRVSSYAERGPSAVNRPLCLAEKCRRNVSMKIAAFYAAVQCQRIHVREIRYVAFKCVFLFPSVSCNGFIPAVAFYQREHQSTRLTFNPKPGQVDSHTHTHTSLLSSARIHVQKHK